jgi:hypothetical protein
VRYAFGVTQRLTELGIIDIPLYYDRGFSGIAFNDGWTTSLPGSTAFAPLEACLNSIQ